MNPEPIIPVGPGAAPPLRVLHLEDDLPDRELVSRVLAGADLACDFIYAACQAEFEAALEGPPFDLILSDFAIPGYDGTSALALAQARYPEVPFLVVSGTIGEERAIHSLKSGATDYVLKHRLERLLPAVQRALREAAERAKRRKAEDALRQSEERFREMADTIQDVFWITSADGTELFYISPAYAQVFGRPVSALLAKRSLWIEAVAASDLPRAQAAWARLA
ncbi:MAG: signal transduction histidine kinase, nitrogen specific, NtrB, partial [Verrucomicrobia bacterium]|nr:signal transduction histidine kinase, nitrogen specific, NtrB [Verrucomicrobiota bacterium]